MPINPFFRGSRVGFAALLMQQSVFAAVGDETFDFFAEEARVTSASRRDQSAFESPVAIDVITAEEIRHSKAKNIWDLLRFQVGMDVIDGRSTDENRAIVSVRGYPTEFQGNLQVLVDGLSVFNPEVNGVYWQQIPVSLSEIHRIEIVRGPNAALYGSNSGLGVINIITKKPSSVEAAEADVARGNNDYFSGSAQANGGGDKVSGRLAYTYKSEDGLVRSDQSRTNDFLNSHKAHTRLLWNVNRSVKAELFGGATRDRVGNTTSSDKKGFDTHFQMARFTIETGDNSNIEVMGARNDFSNDSNGNIENRDYQMDAEILHRVNYWDGRMNTSWGGSYRKSVAYSPLVFALRSSKQVHNVITRGFIHQTARLPREVALVAAFSYEDTDTGGEALAYQAAAVKQLGHDQSVRVSYSRSPTLPSLFDAYAGSRFGPVTIIGNESLNPPTITSYETGYKGLFLEKKLNFKTDLYYMASHHLIETKAISPTRFTVVNGQNSIARGVESEVEYRWNQDLYTYVNHTYEYITDNRGDITFIKGTPRHKVNLGGRFFFLNNWMAGVDVGYKGSQTIVGSSGSGTLQAHAYWRLDARLAYTYKDAELYVAGQNLTRPAHIEFPGIFYVPRTYQVGGSVKFGG